MLIATWNVNSLKARLNTVVDWLKTNQPDILMLQEIKGENNLLSPSHCPDLGYYSVHSLQRTYNGVCTLSKEPARIINNSLVYLKDPQARYLEVKINGITFINIYAPNGNPIDSDKYTYKLSWLTALYNHLKGLVDKRVPFVLAGDFNIIPKGRDTYSEAAFKNDALYQLEPRQIYFKLLNLGLTDALETYALSKPGAEAVYTWWSYRAFGFEKNHGVRIDHILLSPELADRLKTCKVDKEVRGSVKPSDHAPVICELKD